MNVLQSLTQDQKKVESILRYCLRALYVSAIWDRVKHGQIGRLILIHAMTIYYDTYDVFYIHVAYRIIFFIHKKILSRGHPNFGSVCHQIRIKMSADFKIEFKGLNKNIYKKSFYNHFVAAFTKINYNHFYTESPHFQGLKYNWTKKIFTNKMLIFYIYLRILCRQWLP